MNLSLIVILCTCVLVILFGLCSLIAERTSNYGIVDILWSYSFGIVVLLFFYLIHAATSSQLLITGLVLTWSIRLGTHLLIRVVNHHPKEDVRYAQLRIEWSKNLKLKMACFFQIQAISVVLLCTPFYFIFANASNNLGYIEIAGSLLWVIGVAGESIADLQLSRFKNNPLNHKEVCSQGLWRYSRHPNYFFEWIIWVSYFIIACSTPYGWLSIISPAIILYLLLTKTGVPMAEKQSLLSKKEKYSNYQKTTSVFFPWFTKSN